MTSNQSSEKRHSTSSNISVRWKNDPAWQHFKLTQAADGKSVFICLYCGNEYKGGGINRMKYHLAGIKGQITACKKVPHEVRVEMKEIISSIEKVKQDKKIIDYDMVDGNDEYEIENDDVQEILTLSSKGKKQKVSGSLDKFLIPKTTSNDPTIESVFATKEAVWKAKMAIARWMYDACIPFNALRSPYFQQALDACMAIGRGFKGPSYHEIRVGLLKDCKKECQLLIDTYRSKWEDSGCTIMADGWTDIRQRTFINFLTYCPTGLTFIKSIDASDYVKDAPTLFKLFFEVIEWVGPSNVVHIVTDNASNYVLAGTMLQEKYEHIYWSPCVAHCLNLLLKDIANMPFMNNLVSQASQVIFLD